ncbi:hypothetical protein ERO13_D05G310400v2 [Gossypium hirsutum]|uniref:Homeobox-leucine zipper protein HOX3 n=5 Tax=Gossypium TaxID=3633 RepID=A0A1U8J2I6_GOSHI|nr:homeobox-leucine zipper protein HOX3 [Gossypium raimondii]XP_016684550.1 homeobox-leucine zipper protein HOX3-like [Gossypium hirsutum]KAB2031817.1 hypothetical protein ES319_D05G330700v1 [Gossypium barbadense]TYH73728.1 hypothetical protein ES332_D05G349300v1 [Gossypium tomentosum]TYI84059.1 hypothetical protein E1A91_D05G337500v1 [Gossypium mustelinum]KAG4148875.1 hypothetical protein ERO13_D05G310400v2 [Gossypium hirsutum]KJB60926.1 hypothetical protein B456_009G331300 [Gossypium raimon
MAFSSSNLDLTISVPSSARDLDMNRLPSPGSDDEWIASTMEVVVDEENTTNDGVVPRKKLRLSKEQSRLLEESFRQNHTLNPRQKEALASQLKLRPRQVEVWFQNRRARSKLKQTEMEFQYLKRWFEFLTKQNQELQSEVEELRALQVGPPTVISPHSREPLPASTLTTCPRCERVTTISSRGAGLINTTTSTNNTSTTSAHQSRPSSAAG